VNATIIARFHEVTIENGMASFGGYGGGLVNAGQLTITDSVIRSNGTPGSSQGGGGIYNTGSLILQRSVVKSNGAGGGGGIQNEGAITATCVNFMYNQANYGGAILNTTNGRVTVSYSSFRGNTSLIWGGGAIYNYPGSPQVVAPNNYWRDGSAPRYSADPYLSDSLDGDVLASPYLTADPTIEGNPGYDEHCRRQTQKCYGRVVPTLGVRVRDTRRGPWYWPEEENGGPTNTKESLPQNSKLVVTFKAVEDATLWYYVSGYLDENGNESAIIDQDGLPDENGEGGDVHGNWVVQRSNLRLRSDQDPTQPYQGLILEDTPACEQLRWYREGPDCYGGTPNWIEDGDGQPLEDSCTFTYNGSTAAEYATAYAALPNPNASPDNPVSDQFCTYNYGGINAGYMQDGGFQVCAGPDMPIPPNPLPPEEEQPDYPTDCANFTSIGLWYGGLPMTETWFCEDKICACEAEPCPPCPDTPCAAGGKSPSWAGAYYTNQPQYLMGLEGAFVITPSFVASYLGTGVMVDDLPPDDDISAIGEAWRADPNLPEDTNGHGIVKGDIAYVMEPNAEHMMMVAGWGPILSTWQDILQFNYSTLADSYPPNPGDIYYVPYLVDHGPHGARGTPVGGGTPEPMCPNCTHPRPYYALYWTYRAPSADLLGLWQIGSSGNNNIPYFIHIPNTLTLGVELLKKPPVNKEEVSVQ